MSLIETPICNFNEPIKDFSLLSTEEITVSLKDIQGPEGTLIMFICNHCPYVQAIMKEAVTISNTIKGLGIHTVAIMPNDTEYESEDSFDNMKLFSKKIILSFSLNLNICFALFILSEKILITIFLFSLLLILFLI